MSEVCCIMRVRVSVKTGEIATDNRSSCVSKYLSESEGTWKGVVTVVDVVYVGLE